jgi:hypothetical protein
MSIRRGVDLRVLMEIEWYESAEECIRGARVGNII